MLATSTCELCTRAILKVHRGARIGFDEPDEPYDAWCFASAYHLVCHDWMRRTDIYESFPDVIIVAKQSCSPDLYLSKGAKVHRPRS